MRKFFLIAALWLGALAPISHADSFKAGLDLYRQWDYFAALPQFRAAADAGAADAQFMVGAMHAEGKGTSQDYGQALHWYGMAAAQGHAHAQLNLGFMHDQGLGTEPDYLRAHMGLSLAGWRRERPAGQQRQTLAQLMTPAQLAQAGQRWLSR